MPIGHRSDFDFGNSSNSARSEKGLTSIDIPGGASAGASGGASSSAMKRPSDGIGHRAIQDEQSITLEMSEQNRRDELARLRFKTAMTALALVLVTAFALCVGSSTYTLYAPSEVLSCYGAWFSQAFGALSGNALTQVELVATYPHYYAVTKQAGIVVITIIAGVLLSLAGCLYQNAFRNPIAAPTMLGVSNGIRVALVVLVLQFGTAAEYQTTLRYLYCYAGAIVVLVLVFGFSKASVGRKRDVNIVDMVLVGSLVSQALGVIVTYINNYVFSDTDIQTYQNISEVLQVNTEAVSFVALGIAALVSIVPVALFSFKFNVLSFSDEEAKFMGVDAQKLRILALVCGTIMIIAAQIHTGMVSMVSLVVPHVSRVLFGAEFRKQFWGNLFLGALLMVAARCVVSLIPFVGFGLPIGTIVSFMVLPVYIWIMAVQQKSWER